MVIILRHTSLTMPDKAWPFTTQNTRRNYPLKLHRCQNWLTIPTSITVYVDDTHRLNLFLNQGESFNCYWKADDNLQCWYTNSHDQAELAKEVQTEQNNGEEILHIWEPGEITYSEWKIEKMSWDRIDFTNMKEHYGIILEIVTTEGEFVQYEILNSSHAGDMQIEADRTGYYTLCFYLSSDYDKESVNVVLRYWVVR